MLTAKSLDYTFAGVYHSPRKPGRSWAELEVQMDETSERRAEPPELLTLQDVAVRCRLGRTLLYEEIGAGRLRVVRFGRAVRVRSDDLAAWIEERTAATAADRAA